jgi:magnesium-transporting ATPase (P-type)
MMLLPLLFVVVIDAIFLIIEDMARHRADAHANASPTAVWDPDSSCFRHTPWSEVRVGQVLKIKNREPIPADVLILGVSAPSDSGAGGDADEHEQQHQHGGSAPSSPAAAAAAAKAALTATAGVCYVETKSLDGETNLKIRHTVKGLAGAVKHSSDAGCVRGRVTMEHPNKLINNFTGTLHAHVVPRQHKHASTTAATAVESESSAQPLKAVDGVLKGEPVDPENLLLRGCILRNTRYAIVLVLNTGMDTKIMMSMSAAPTKSSRLSYRVNREIKRVACLMLCFCVVGAVLGTAWGVQNDAEAWYLSGSADRLSSGKRASSSASAGSVISTLVETFFYYVLLLNSFIPISLYVSMNFVRFFQGWFMNQDLDMYHAESDTPARVRTMNLNEDLGQVRTLQWLVVCEYNMLVAAVLRCVLWCISSTTHMGSITIHEQP